jgi:hypothetical protein
VLRLASPDWQGWRGTWAQDVPPADRALAVVALATGTAVLVASRSGAAVPGVALWLVLLLPASGWRAVRVQYPGLVLPWLQPLLTLAVVAEAVVDLGCLVSCHGEPLLAGTALLAAVSAVTAGLAGQRVRRRRVLLLREARRWLMARSWQQTAERAHAAGARLEMVLMSQVDRHQSHVLLDDGAGQRRSALIWGRWAAGTWLHVDELDTVVGWASDDCRVAAQQLAGGG